MKNTIKRYPTDFRAYACLILNLMILCLHFVMASKSDRLELGLGLDNRILDTLGELSDSDFNPSRVAGQGSTYFPWVSPRVIDLEALQASGCAL